MWPWEKTENEKKRNKYKDLVDDLEGLIENMDKYIGESDHNDASKPVLKQFTTLIDGAGDLSEGKMVSDFEKTGTSYKKEFKKSIRKMKLARTELKGKLEEAKEWYSCYDRLVRAEKEE